MFSRETEVRDFEDLVLLVSNFPHSTLHHHIEYSSPETCETGHEDARRREGEKYNSEGSARTFEMK